MGIQRPEHLEEDARGGGSCAEYALDLEKRISLVEEMHRQPAASECAVCTEVFNDPTAMFTCETLRILLSEAE